MALSEDFLKPIDGPNPSGENIRFNARYPVYDKIKEARREDEELPEGVWQHERKLADYPLVIKLAEEALTTKTKDLQLAAWLTEALLKTQGFKGLWEGLKLCRGLVNGFWDTLYPEIEDGDAEMRATPLDWIGGTLDFAVRSVPLTRDGYAWTKYQESRTVGFEDQAKSDNEKKARQKLLAAGKLAPEDFQKSFVESPKAFYLQAEKDLDGCVGDLDQLDQLCQEKFGDASPGFGKLKTALEEVRHIVHGLLEKKRETEPDPVEETPAATEGAEAGAAVGEGLAARPSGAIVISIESSSEPADRRAAIVSIANAAAFLRKREPQNPASYLMLRGFRWGELRAAGRLTDPTLLEAPPAELRRHIKKLALDRKWSEMLEAAESAMALPSSRGWLDLQRFVVEACTALGPDYEPIAAAIRSELNALLGDLPELLDANLLDDTPAANAETRNWLRSLMQPQAAVSSESAPESAMASNGNACAAATSGWPRRSVDNYTLAKEALKAGQVEKAFQIMQKEIAMQRSGRGRFFRKAELVELCIAAGKETIAQPLLDDIAAAIEAHKLEEWENREVVAATLATIMTSSGRVKGNAAEKQKLFERICRLDPVRALTSG